MSTTADTFPDDVAALRVMLLEARAERDAAHAENARLAAQNDRLRHLIRQLQRLQFGRRSEKLDPDQLIRAQLAAQHEPSDGIDGAGASSSLE